MKVAVFVSNLPPHMGGLEIAVENQIKALSEAGHRVRVITSACSAESGAAFVDGYHIRRIPAWNFLEEKFQAPFPIFSPSLLYYAYRAVKAADVVHAHDAFYLTSLAAALWARILRKPLILTQHVDEIPHPRRIVRLGQQVVYATTGQFILRTSARIIVLNSRVKTFLTDKHVDEKKIVFVPNGINTDMFGPADETQQQSLREKLGLPLDKTLALFAGRFVPKKGFTKLMRLEPIEDLNIVFAGGHAPAGHTRTDHHFLGQVRHETIPEVFKAYDIFVLPSEGEGFPVTVQEAMAGGLAIITTDDPAYEWYNLSTDYIKLIRPTIENIREALADLSHNYLKQDAARQYTRDYAVRNFSLRANAEQLADVYTEVLTGNTIAEALPESRV